MALAVVIENVSALRRDMIAVVASLEVLTDTVAAQGRLLTAVLEAVTADEPVNSALVDALVRIAATLQDQAAGIEAMRVGISRLPDAMRNAVQV